MPRRYFAAPCRRVCLRCRRPFESSDASNRLCGGCNVKNLGASIRDTPLAGGHKPRPREVGYRKGAT